MVALRTHKDDKRKIPKTAQDGSKSGGGTIEEMCGMRWPHVWAGKED